MTYRILTYALFHFLPFITIGQNIKIYDGVYKDGKAKYQYYEDNTQHKILHGFFKYTTNNSKLEGFFDHGKKDGFWKYSKTITEVNQVIHSELSGSYNFGKITSTWKFTEVIKDPKGKVLHKENRETAFNDGSFSKKIICNELTIYLNEVGFIQGVSEIQFKKENVAYAAKYLYDAGVLHNVYIYNPSTKEIIENADYSELVLSLNKYFSFDQNIVSIGGSKYTKQIFGLEFTDSSKSVEYKHAKISTNVHADITELVENRKCDNNGRFEFQSLITSHSEAYDKIASAILFWFNVVSGDYFNVTEGNASVLLYPEASISNVNIVDGKIERRYDLDNMFISMNQDSLPSTRTKRDIPSDIYEYTEKMPDFPGGEDALAEFIAQNIKYPIEAVNNGIQGRVTVRFVINEDGSLSNILILRGIGGGCDEEVIRLVKKMPKWIPGEQNGIKVKVSFSLPIGFNLENVNSLYKN